MKSFLHRIVKGDEKWFYFENLKRKKSWMNLGAPSTSTTRPNRFGRNTMLCVWWDQRGVVYYDLLKPTETVNTERCQQQLTDLNLSPLEKKARKTPNRRGNTKSFFFMTMLHYIWQNRYYGNSLVRSSTPSDLQTRLGSFRLPLVRID